MRPIAITTTLLPKKTISAIGDSLTHNTVWGVPIHLYWPTVLAASLNSNGANVIARNFGISGETTTQMLARIGNMLTFDIPTIGCIWGCTNDPGNEISAETTTSNLVAMANALLAAGCNKIVLLSPHYNNWNGGGNNTAGNAAVGPAPTDSTLTLWNDVNSAYTTLVASNPGKIVFVDLYGWFYALLVANPSWVGVDTKWNIGPGNLHLNIYGEAQVAAAVQSSIQNAGWLPSLA